MKNEFQLRGYMIRRFTVLVVMLGTIGVASALSSAYSPNTSVTINNNSSREISHIYLSPTDQENWGTDQLTSSVSAGGSFTLSASCSAANIKVIAEDADGCFFYQVVTCGQSMTWTITNDSGRDCGN